MDTNTKKTLADYMKEVEPYKEGELWVDDCKDLKDVARALVTLDKELKEGKFSKPNKKANQENKND